MCVHTYGTSQIRSHNRQLKQTWWMLCVHLYIHTYIYIYIYMYVCIRIYIFIYMCVCTYI